MFEVPSMSLETWVGFESLDRCSSNFLRRNSLWSEWMTSIGDRALSEATLHKQSSLLMILEHYFINQSDNEYLLLKVNGSFRPKVVQYQLSG